MTWFADSSPYTYFEAPRLGGPTLNVGWLERGQPFPTGDVPAQLASRIALLVEHAPTQATRGLHFCDLCPGADEIAKPHGSAEIRAVAADGTRFAAPTLVHHYVAVHHYLPPQAFLDAIARTASLTREDAWARDLCLACGTTMKREGAPFRIEDADFTRIHCQPMECTGCGTTYVREWRDE